MMAGKMMAGVSPPPPPLKLELKETGAVLRLRKEVKEKEKEEEVVLREEVETTSAGTAVRLVITDSKSR